MIEDKPQIRHGRCGSCRGGQLVDPDHQIEYQSGGGDGTEPATHVRTIQVVRIGRRLDLGADSDEQLAAGQPPVSVDDASDVGVRDVDPSHDADDRLRFTRIRKEFGDLVDMAATTLDQHAGSDTGRVQLRNQVIGRERAADALQPGLIEPPVPPFGPPEVMMRIDDQSVTHVCAFPPVTPPPAAGPGWSTVSCGRCTA